MTRVVFEVKNDAHKEQIVAALNLLDPGDDRDKAVEMVSVAFLSRCPLMSLDDNRLAEAIEAAQAAF